MNRVPGTPAGCVRHGSRDLPIRRLLLITTPLDAASRGLGGGLAVGHAPIDLAGRAGHQRLNSINSADLPRARPCKLQSSKTAWSARWTKQRWTLCAPAPMLLSTSRLREQRQQFLMDEPVNFQAFPESSLPTTKCAL